MSWSQATTQSIKRLQGAQRRLADRFVGREREAELLVLAAVCQEHLLLIGPPGTGKTALISRFNELIEARGFHYLLSRFTEPSELFGPLDLEKFRQGQYQIITNAMLPEAQIAFLDEVFQGSSAILNALLTLINERIYHNGSTRQRVPLISLVGASNELPSDPGLQAFADRFALRHELSPVPDAQLEDLIHKGWELESQRIVDLAKGEAGVRATPAINVEQLTQLHHELPHVQLDQVRDDYAQILREMRAQGLEISDRQAVKGLKLVAGAALLRLSESASAQDFWPLAHIWNKTHEAQLAREIVEPRVEAAGGTVISSKRTPELIRSDLGVLCQRTPGLRSEPALAAHLMALNRLRREALLDHRDQPALIEELNRAIAEAMCRLEEPHV